MNHPLIIGAGGVASYLLPVLLKTFKPGKLTIIDKDVLEERNLDRQLFHSDQVGQAKATALLDLTMPHPYHENGGCALIEWFSDSTVIPDDIDAIICCADNHQARYAAMQRAEMLGITAYIGGNEFFDSQAFVYRSEWKGTPKDPLVRYPSIATDHTGSPFRCQGEAQEIFPQLAVANFGCAAKLMQLLWIYEVWIPENRLQLRLSQEAIDSMPYELFTSVFENTSK
jgi:molybdopterin/thiamine biosynthesis adenylyltransferase